MIALIVGAIMRFTAVDSVFYAVLFLVVLVNVMLFFFNLIPVPPLDGSKILSALLPESLARGYNAWRDRLEANPLLGMGLVLLVILLLGGSFGSFVHMVARGIVGL